MSYCLSLDFDELLKLLTVLLTWPVVSLAMLIIVVCVFKQHLRDLIDRLKSISTKYISATFGDARAVATSKDTVFPNYSRAQVNNVEQRLSLLLQDVKRCVDLKDNEKAVDLLLEANRLAPNQLVILHNLGVLLIRLGKAKEDNIEYLIQAEVVCKQALYLDKSFPYGTLYNLARAQAASGNINGLKETLYMISKVTLPDNLGKAIVDGDNDFEGYDKVKALQEYQDLRKSIDEKLKVK